MGIGEGLGLVVMVRTERKEHEWESGEEKRQIAL